MTTAFEFGFFEELQKIAAKAEKSEYEEKGYRPTTVGGHLLDTYVKHPLYGAAGYLGGGLAGAGLGALVGKLSGKEHGTAKGALLGGVLGASAGSLAGSLRSRFNARKRMKQRLIDQGLDEKTLKKLEDEGVFKAKGLDMLPIGGNLMAGNEIRSALRRAGKKARGAIMAD